MGLNLNYTKPDGHRLIIGKLVVLKIGSKEPEGTQPGYMAKLKVFGIFR